MLLTRRWLLWPQAVREVYPGLVVRPRSEWTDAEPAGELVAEEVRFLLVHHTAGNTQHSEADVPAILGGIRAFHVREKGWPDIAYNFLIDRYGQVWEGRAGSLDGPVRGDATGGNQGFSQLVCLIGDFTAELPTPEAQEALVLTLAWRADRYEIDTGPGASVGFVSRGSNRWPEGTEVTATPIAGHRDMSHTSCPGDAFYPVLLEEIAPRVHAARTSTTETSVPDTTSPPHTTSTTTTTTTTATTSTTVPPTPTSVAPPNPSTTPMAAESPPSGLEGLRWPALSIGAGVVLALAGWRARRMSRRR